MSIIKQHLLNSYDYLGILFLLLLPFSNSGSNIVFCLLTLIYFIDFKIESFAKIIGSPFLILTILVFYLYFQAICNGSFTIDFTYYKIYLYLFFSPLIFNKIASIDHLKKAALLSINATIIISFYKILNFYFAFNYFPFRDGWATNFVLLLERPYAGILSIISIIISFDFILQNTKCKIIYYLSLGLSLFFICFISIRISILTLLLLFVTYILFYLRLSFKRKFYLFSFLFALFAGLFIYNKNISKRFFIGETVQETVATTRQYEPRIVILNCVQEIINQPSFSFWFGTDSYSNIQYSLNECYKSTIQDYSRRNWFLEKKFNAHSQFVDFFLIGGLIASFLFIGFIVYFIALVHKNFIAVSLVISFIMFLLVENIFHRQLGCLIFATFMVLYYSEVMTKKNEKN